MSHVHLLRTAVGDAVSRWATESQQGARRNAMIASTAMAAQRKERADVDEFLAGRGQVATPSYDGTGEVRGAL